MSTLSDSDDSDDDFLLKDRIFAKSKAKVKPELTPITTLERIVEGKSIEPKKDDTETSTGRKRMQARQKQQPNRKRAMSNKAKPDNNRNDEIARAKRQSDPKWIEAQARKTVDEVLTVGIVDKITNLDDIGWYQVTPKKTGKKRIKSSFYPVRDASNTAEGKFLLGDSNKKKIQYIGVGWGSAFLLDTISLSKWIPLSKSSDLENEERLQNFLKIISKSSLFKNDPLSLKIEELAVRKMWEKVRTQQEQRLRNEEKERAEALGSAGKSASSAPAVPPMTITQDSDNNCNEQEAVDDDSDDDDDDDDDCDNAIYSSPGGTREKRIPLRLNDEIEFYDLMGTFGNPSSLRRATVVGVRPSESSYPLLLSNTTIPIPGTHRVRRLPDGVWQPINDYKLSQEGIQSEGDSGSGLSELTNKMRKINDKIVEAKEDFWKNGCGTSEKDETTGGQDDDDLGKEEKTKGSTSVVNNDGIDHSAGNVLPVRRSRRSSSRVRSEAK